MPWPEHRIVDLKREFVLSAQQPNCNMSELCRKAGISRKTGYFWLKRFKESGLTGLEERSHRRKTARAGSAELVLRIVELRKNEDSRFWGPKKMKELLELDLDEVPSIKTIARLCNRLGLPPLREKPVPTVARASRRGGVLRTKKCNAIWTSILRVGGKRWMESASSR